MKVVVKREPSPKGFIKWCREFRTIYGPPWRIIDLHKAYRAGFVENHALVEELLAQLKQVQFGFNHRRCAVCAGWNMSPNGETDMVHTKECSVALAIQKAES